MMEDNDTCPDGSWAGPIGPDAAQLAEKEREIAFLLPQRNKWAMLCQHFGVPEKETCVATITDKFVAAEQRLQEAQVRALSAEESLRQREAELEQLREHVEWIRLHGRDRVAQTRDSLELNAFNQGRVDGAESTLIFWDDLKRRLAGRKEHELV